ncbi:MAG: EpsG family protein [Lachnospiraceae bacterium]|nr:EpsG family protein [Lachnospiraceae bacterium]
MTIYLILACITIALSMLVEQKENIVCEKDARILTKGWLKNFSLLFGIFFALLMVSACRIAIGNDYWEYTSIFSLIDQNRHVSTEFGFNAFVRACHFLFGKDNYIVIFGLVAAGTIYFSMRSLYRLSEKFGYSFFLYMVFGIYLSGFNSIRYYLVLAVAMYAVTFLFTKEYEKFVLLLLLASTFHMAVLFCLVVYPVAKLKWKVWVYPVLGVFAASLLAFPNFYRRIIFFFYPYYENSVYDTQTTSVVQIARCVAVLVFALIFYKTAVKDSEKNRFYFQCNLLALIVYCCCSFMPVISRIGYFLNVYQIFLIPSILLGIKSKKARVTLTVLIALCGVGYYLFFLHTSRDVASHIVPYWSWITH